MNVQLLVLAEKLPHVLDCIEQGKIFEATVNCGFYVPRQFATIIVDTSKFIIKDIRLDTATKRGGKDKNGDELNQTHESYDCTVVPRNYKPITSDSERKLEPEL